MPDFLGGRVRPVTLFANMLVAFFGLFQLLFTVVVRMGWSFRTLMVTLPLVVIGTAATVSWVHRTDEPPPEPDSAMPSASEWQLKWGLLTLPLVAAGAILMDAGVIGYPVFLGVALLHLGIVAWGTSPRLAWNREPLDAYSAAALAVAVIAGVVISLLIIRPEGDDGYYIAQALGSMEHPELPLLSFDVMHNQLDWPVQQVAHRAQGFETWCSVLFTLLPMDHLDIYYLLQCGFFAGCTAVSSFVLVRALTDRSVAATSTLMLVGVLLVWGGSYYGWGNFTYVRMFQGKAVLVSVFGPLCVWRALAFTAEPNPRTWLMLALAQCAVAFCTSTGLVVAPICAGLVVLAGLSADRRGAILAGAGVLTSAPVLLMLGFVKLDLAVGITETGTTGLRRGIREALGGDGRLGFALIAVLAAPLLLRWWKSPGGDWAARYLFVAFALLVNETTTSLIADVAGDLFTWRTYWAMPMATLVSISLAVAVHMALSEHPAKVRGIAMGGTLLWLLCFTAAGPPAWDSQNVAHVDWFQHKVRHQPYLVAKTVLEHLGPDDLVVVPESISPWIAMHRDKPTMLGTRRIYTDHLRPTMGEQMYETHMTMLDFADGYGRAKVDDALRDIDRLCVTGVVIRPKVRRRYPEAQDLLRERGFQRITLPDEHTAGYRFFKRDKSACTGPEGEHR